MYSGSLNVSSGSGGDPFRGRGQKPPVPRPRRISERSRSSSAGDASLLDEQPTSFRDYVNRLYECLREAFRGESDEYDPDLEDLDLGIIRHVPVSLDSLTKSTEFSRKEIQLIYRGFKQDCPTGVVSAEKFRELYSQFFPLGDASGFARQIFQMMDQDMDGSVSFEEFLVVMSMLSRGSLDEKLQWVFNLYDLRGEGYLTPETLNEIGISIYEMLGKYTEPPIHEQTVKDHVNRIFVKMDSDGDGMVTFSEFKEFCVNDDRVRHNLCVFNSLL